MKKLIALIGAVATAFGLYAAGSSYYATSFEPGYDNGCTAEPLAFNLSEAGWTAGTTTETSLDLGTYESGEGYAYPTEGKGLRRDALFLGNDTNTKYLKLETGSSSVGKTIGEGEVFIDQTVKFTGFEEVPAADAIDGQIAIWASAIEADDTVEPAIVGETNLYARVGTGTGFKDVKIAIDDFDLAKWYRLTIKSLGNVIDSAKGDEIQAGFLVYINGNLATIAAAHQSYSTIADHFETNAGRYYSKGQLFTGMGATAAFTTVAFQGIGSIDDFVTSVEAPDFAEETPTTVKLTVTIPENTVLTITNAAGEEISHENGVAQVAPGTRLWLVFTAADGYTMDPVTKEITVGDADETVSYTDIIARPIVVTLTWNNYTESASYADLTAALAKIADLQPSLAEGAKIEMEALATIEPVQTSAGKLGLNEGSWTAICADGSWEGGDIVISGTLSHQWKVDAVQIIEGETLTLAATGVLIAPVGTLDIGAVDGYTVNMVGPDEEKLYTYTAVKQSTQAFEPSEAVTTDLATAIAYLKNNYYNKYTNGDKVDAPDASFVKVGTLASGVSGTVSIGGEVAKADEKFSLSIGNNAFLESYKFKIVNGDVYVAAVILAIEEVKVTANAKDYLIDSASSGQLALESFAAVAPTTIEDKGTNFAVVRGDDKPLVKFFFTDKVTQYFVTKKTFIGKNDVATTSYGFTTPDEGGLWLYLGYGVGLGGNWDGVTYNYTVYAFGVDKKAITLSMSITDKSGELTSWDDVTDNTPIAELPCLSDADKTALAAAEVSATKVSAWAKGNGKVTIGTDTIKLEAFLLNVENTDTAIAAEKAAFKIPSITVNADGTVTVTEPTGSYNGTITIKGSTTPNGDFTLPVTDTSARFFKAFLGL